MDGIGLGWMDICVELLYGHRFAVLKREKKEKKESKEKETNQSWVLITKDDPSSRASVDDQATLIRSK